MVESMISDQVARWRRRRTAPVILELDLTDGLLEERPADPLSAALLARRRLLLADVLDGLRRACGDGRVRALVSAINLTLLAVPIFVLGLLLLLVFGFRLGVAPVTGGAGPAQIVLPALTLGLIGAPWYAQIVADLWTDYQRLGYAAAHNDSLSSTIPSRCLGRSSVLIPSKTILSASQNTLIPNSKRDNSAISPVYAHQRGVLQEGDLS
jgi:hypothetical protein